ncbi:MAG: protein phosphatase 2C domain-containing protein [Syntrophobacteraceae bacterium]|jgi:protein phosphatase
MQVESITNQGLHRLNNEDRCLVNILDNDCALLAIADGMGGHAGGEVAAELALESFAGYRPSGPDIRAALLNQILEAQKRVVERSRACRSLKGMGTTLTALFITGKSAFWAHVGDTRIYLLHEGSLTRITEDHTVPGMLLKKGEITLEQARVHPYGNVLTRCVGSCCDRPDPDSGTFGLTHGDHVLLSSDGLHDLISDEQIAAFLSVDVTLTEKLDRMISACLEAGGTDNITAVVARI